MKKRLFSLSIAILMLIALMGCFGSCANRGEVITLYVYNWGEYISDGSEGSVDVNRAFEAYCEEELGIKVKVNYSTYSSNEDMFAKVSSKSSVYDVVVPSDYMIQRMAMSGMLLPLDLEKIPNYQYILDRFKGDNVYYEPGDGKIYSVPYTYGMVGIIYNTAKVPSENPNIGSWELMWDETLGGNILQFNNSRDAFGTALYSLGYDVNDATEEQWREALEKLKSQKDLVQGYVMDEIFNKMKGGSAAVAAYYAGDFLSMYEDNEDLAFFYPREGTNIYVDAMCIPTSSKNPELAMAYINFMCSEDIAVANAEYHYYASPNSLVLENAEYREYMSDIHPDAMEILYDSVDDVKSQAYMNLTAEKQARLNTLWEELKVESRIGRGIYVLCGVIVAALAAYAVHSFLRRRRWAKLYD